MEYVLFKKGESRISVERIKENNLFTNSLLLFYSNSDTNKKIIISNDFQDYVINTLDRALSNFISGDASRYVLRNNQKYSSLGEAFNKYSFELGHSENIDEVDEDATANYGVFNDNNNLFFYSKNGTKFIEISSIYDHNNALNKTSEDLEKWIKKEYIFIVFEITQSELQSFYNNTQLLKSQLK